jgi:hypothetical protein
MVAVPQIAGRALTRIHLSLLYLETQSLCFRARLDYVFLYRSHWNHHELQVQMNTRSSRLSRIKSSFSFKLWLKCIRSTSQKCEPTIREHLKLFSPKTLQVTRVCKVMIRWNKLALKLNRMDMWSFQAWKRNFAVNLQPQLWTLLAKPVHFSTCACFHRV